MVKHQHRIVYMVVTVHLPTCFVQVLHGPIIFCLLMWHRDGLRVVGFQDEVPLGVSQEGVLSEEDEVHHNHLL